VNIKLLIKTSWCCTILQR